MPSTVLRMTFRELLEEYGIHSMPELRQRTGLSKQYAWALWHGRVNLGLQLARRLSQQLSIPLPRLLDVERAIPPAPRRPGRPPKQSHEEPGA
jgi:transcriptional regulator with XRE-family HTH domain